VKAKGLGQQAVKFCACAYFMLAEICAYIVPVDVAKVLIAPQTARKIKAQISPYSIDVAPLSFTRKRLTRRDIQFSQDQAGYNVQASPTG
jgi:hypothetical protein